MASDDAMSDAASDSSSSSSVASFHIEHELPFFTPPSSLPNFWKLPRKLQHRIIALACGPPLVSSRSTIIGRSIDDTTTTLRLIQTSRFFYTQATPFLYAHVRITRPSVLLAFQRALAGRPSLGQMVKSLHIGPDEALLGHWWPMRESDSGFRLNVGGAEEGNGSWLDSEVYEVYLDANEYSGDEALYDPLLEAFAAASKDLGVNLQVEARDYAGNVIEENVWYMRVLELQSALELYYLEVERRERESVGTSSKKAKGKSKSTSRKAATCYPRLQVSPGTSKSRSKRNGDVFHVTKAQIFHRMVGGGAPTDSFSHPILFARSGLKWVAPDIVGRIHSAETGVRKPHEAAEIIDVFSTTQLPIAPTLSQVDGSVQMASAAGWDPLGLASPSSTTVGGCLALAHSILSLTPQVRCLSLTGFLEQTVVGKRPPCHQDLESVTLGPLTAAWGLVQRLHHSALYSIKRLRLCGDELADSEIESLAGASGARPGLSTIRWSMASRFDEEHPPTDMIESIFKLLAIDQRKNSQDPSMLETYERSRKRPRMGSSDSDQPPASYDEDEDRDKTPRSLYIEAHFHPYDVSAVLEAAPTKEIAEAWKEGKAVAGVRHRLKVCKHRAYSDSDVFAWADTRAIQALYDEGRTWWEEGSGGGVAD